MLRLTGTPASQVHFACLKICTACATGHAADGLQLSLSKQAAAKLDVQRLVEPAWGGTQKRKIPDNSRIIAMAIDIYERILIEEADMHEMLFSLHMAS